MPPKPEKREKVFKFIEANLLKGICPSYTEIQRHFGLESPSTVAKHVSALVATGLLEHTPGSRRGLRLTRPIETSLPIPYLGAISAGLPQSRDPENDSRATSDLRSFGIPINRRTFNLIVKGDSMCDAGILDGDTVILEHGMEPRDGDVVAAFIDGENTLKRYVIQGRKHFLQAANAKYKDLIPREELMIQGVVVGVVRPVRKALK